MSDLEISPATTSDVSLIFEMLSDMFREQTMPALDPNLAAREIMRVCEHEAAWVVREGDRLVGTMGLVSANVWYSQESILVTRWLYALPEHRGAQGAWGLMMHEAKELAALTQRKTWLDVFNPEKNRRARKLQEGFARFSFDPAGARLFYDPVDATSEAA